MDKTMKELKVEVTDMGLDHSMNIYQRMLKAQSMVETVSKNLQVDAGKQRYKAVSERDILDAVKKVEDKCGIYSYPFERKVYENKATVNKNGYETQWMRIQTVYRFINIDKPEEFIDVTTYGDGVDTMDKAPGKAMTYADKYALMKAYKISTGDDPDKEASEEQKPKQQNPKQQKPPEPATPKKSMEQLTVEWQSCRNKLFDLGVDIHSETIIQWMADKTGYPSQDIDLTDPLKMEKIISAYRILISGKEKANHNA